VAWDDIVQVRFGAPDNVLEIQVGTIEVDEPRSVGYFGGLAAAVGLRLIEPPLALFVAAVPLFKALTNTTFPPPIRAVGEVLEGAAKPVGSDAQGVIQLIDQRQSPVTTVEVRPRTATTRRTSGRRSAKTT
jgi:hypothetical protein